MCLSSNSPITKRVSMPGRPLSLYSGAISSSIRPVDLAGKLHQLVVQIDDLVEPGPEQIALSCRRALLGSHATLRCAANHGWTPRRIAKKEIARFRCLMAPHLAIPNPLPGPKPIPDQFLTSSSRATCYGNAIIQSLLH